MLDMTDHYLARHLDEQEAADDRADRFDDAKEAVTAEKALAIRAALVKPGSNVGLLITHDTDEWIDGIDALVRRAADPLPLLPEQKLRLADEFIRLLNATIAHAAEPDDKAVQARIDEDLRCAGEPA